MAGPVDTFSPENIEKARVVIQRYADGLSASQAAKEAGLLWSVFWRIAGNNSHNNINYNLYYALYNFDHIFSHIDQAQIKLIKGVVLAPFLELARVPEKVELKKLIKELEDYMYAYPHGALDKFTYIITRFNALPDAIRAVIRKKDNDVTLARELGSLYEIARPAKAEYLISEIERISNEVENGNLDYNSARLISGNHMALAGRLHRSRFGDTKDVNVNVEFKIGDVLAERKRQQTAMLSELEGNKAIENRSSIESYATDYVKMIDIASIEVGDD